MSHRPIPTVSIGVPVYNGERFVGELLDSLLAQTFGDFEIVVSDNASTDATVDIVRRFAAQDERIRLLVAPENRGAGWNFNHVLAEARGRYFKWQACDDIIEPTFLERCVELLDASPDVVVAYTGVRMVDESLRPIEDYGIRLDLGNPDPVVRFAETLLRWFLCYEVFGVIRSDALARTRGMGNFSHGDGVLLAHLALLGPFAHVDDRLFLSRQHAGQSMAQFGHEGGGNDYQSYAVWFDPSLAGRLTMPNWKILAEYVEVVRDTPELSARQRRRCAVVLARRLRLDARLLLGDLWFAARWLVARIARPVTARRSGT